MVYGAPTGTTSFSPGLAIGFPIGSPTGVVYAFAKEVKAVARAVKRVYFILKKEKKILKECEAVGARQKLKPEGEKKIFPRGWL